MARFKGVDMLLLCLSPGGIAETRLRIIEIETNRQKKRHILSKQVSKHSRQYLLWHYLMQCNTRWRA